MSGLTKQAEYARQRLRCWIRDYGHKSQKVFIEDMLAVLDEMDILAGLEPYQPPSTPLENPLPEDIERPTVRIHATTEGPAAPDIVVELSTTGSAENFLGFAGGNVIAHYDAAGKLLAVRILGDCSSVNVPQAIQP